MLRSLALLLVLATAAFAGEIPLRAFFDPGESAFRLPVLTNEQFAKLRGAERLWARGIDPEFFFDPPAFKDSIPQAMNRRSTLAPGYGYHERLIIKRRLWSVSARDSSPEQWVGLIELVPLREPQAFLQHHLSLTKGLRGGVDLTQVVQALRHSERMFRMWWLDHVGRESDAARSAENRRIVRSLAKLFRHASPEVRLAAARVLGGIRSDEARRLAERTLAGSRDPGLRAALVSARLRQGGHDLARRMELWSAHGDEAVSRAVIRELAAVRQKWALSIIQKCNDTAKNMLFEECNLALGAHGGVEPLNEGPIDFYGIRTRSRRILFCIDISTSMGFPMDGMNGKLEPRRRRTLRELTRTLENLPDGVEFNILGFSSRQNPLWRRLRKADDKTRAAALEFARNVPLEGGTDIYGAFLFALHSGADTVFFLTDGEPSTGVLYDTALLLEEICHRNRHGTLRVHCIGLSRDQNTELLYNLAKRNTGRYVADR